MAQKKVPAKRGPKPIPIDYEAIEKNAARGLTKEEIIKKLYIGRSTFYLNKRTDKKIDQAIQNGRINFKIFNTDILINQAQRGNVAAAIWLDKTRCGVRETTDEHRQSEAAPVKIVYEDQ